MVKKFKNFWIVFDLLVVISIASYTVERFLGTLPFWRDLGIEFTKLSFADLLIIIRNFLLVVGPPTIFIVWLFTLHGRLRRRKYEKLAKEFSLIYHGSPKFYVIGPSERKLHCLQGVINRQSVEICDEYEEFRIPLTLATWAHRKTTFKKDGQLDKAIQGPFGYAPITKIREWLQNVS